MQRLRETFQHTFRPLSHTNCRRSLRKVFHISKERLMNRGYQRNLKEKLLSEINETHRNWKSALLKQYSEEENEMLPFVTQYQPLVSTVKEALMEKWNLIQNQPLLC